MRFELRSGFSTITTSACSGSIPPPHEIVALAMYDALAASPKSKVL